MQFDSNPLSRYAGRTCRRASPVFAVSQVWPRSILATISIQRNTCATLWYKLAKLGLHLCSCLTGQSWCT